MEHLILASASPQRKTLLEGLGMPFTVIPSTFDESQCTESDPAKRAVVLAEAKARDVARSHPGACVIGCDTLVVAQDGSVHEKPRDAGEARTMIRKQSGGMNTVHSGLCVIGADGRPHADISSSAVHFAFLDDATIEWWMRSGFWRDRSGAFQIDGPGQLMISRLEGDWTSVVGLPVFLLGQLLKEAGHRWEKV